MKEGCLPVSLEHRCKPTRLLAENKQLERKSLKRQESLRNCPPQAAGGRASATPHSAGLIT